MMGLRNRVDGLIARQFARPSGRLGRLTAAALNRGNSRAIEGAVKALPLASPEIVADVGFGGGLGLQLLLDRPGVAVVHGVEISDEMIQRARVKFPADLLADRLQLHSGSINALPLADSSMDGIISVNTIYFIDDLAQGFGELARALSDSGVAVVGIGDPEAMKDRRITAHGFRLRSLVEIEGTMQTVGLRLVEHARLGDGPAAGHLLVAVKAMNGD